jgi:hypothetical protein
VIVGAIADANEALDAILHRIHEGLFRKDTFCSCSRILLVNVSLSQTYFYPLSQVLCTLLVSISSFKNTKLDVIIFHLPENQPVCPGPPKCLAHHVFGGLLMEQSVCLECRASSEPCLRSDFVHCVYAAEMISLAFECPGQTFGKLLNQCLKVAPRGCPSNDEIPKYFPSSSSPSSPSIAAIRCGGTARVSTYSLEAPLALAVTVAWTTNNEAKETLEQFLSLLSYTVRYGYI